MVAPDDFRRVLGHFGTGVTVVTTTDADKRPTGLTCSAFSSVSLDPPLVLVCVDHKSQSFPALREFGRFAVNILRADQEAVSRRFATSRILDKFEGVPHTISALGLPLVEGALAHLECVTVNTHVEGDHTIFVGRVERVSAPGGDPLLYFRGRYERLVPDASESPIKGGEPSQGSPGPFKGGEPSQGSPGPFKGGEPSQGSPGPSGGGPFGGSRDV